jgi:asparagine synthase (glutamine-hydrolysing)
VCGIAGLFDPLARPRDWPAILEAAARTLRHRGPDDEGCWWDPRDGIGLAHRRLSILDVSPTGSQPMTSRSGRLTIAYNGELYNHCDLRAELQSRGRRFAGTSDTEVALEALDCWGLHDAIRRFNGMFAFAVWDRARRELHVVRDRLGIKPLYFCDHGGAFVFGSELKALRALGTYTPELDPSALACYLLLGYVPAPHAIDRGVRKLAPATILTVTRGSDGATLREQRYWSMPEAREQCNHSSGDPATPAQEHAAIEQLDGLLRDAVGTRMVADVPLGAFLSGGIDSSTVVALMQTLSARPVKTFSIGYDDPEFSEADHARRVAEHLGTEHTELIASSQEALGVIPALAEMYDEPFADSSQIPTCLVSRLARQQVTVSLSGDGGDELFHGYRRYEFVPRIWQRLARYPYPLRAASSKLIAWLSPEWCGNVAALIEPSRRRHYARMFRHAERVLRARTPEELLAHFTCCWNDPPTILARDYVEAAGRPGACSDGPREADAALPGSPREQLACRFSRSEQQRYLPDDILTKLDRASMAVSLEARVPLLDHRVVELAASLPASMKIREGSGKWILGQVLARYVPPRLFDRPKRGFGVPLGSWLRGPLRDWAEDLLAPERLRRDGVFRVPAIRAAWQAHVDRCQDLTNRLWCVLVFQAWLHAK